MFYAIVHQVSHVLTILINSGTLLHAKEEVGDLCTFTSDNGREDAVKIFEVYLFQTRSNATVQENYLGVVHIGILNKDVARVKVTMNKIMNKKLQRERERESNSSSVHYSQHYYWVQTYHIQDHLNTDSGQFLL